MLLYLIITIIIIYVAVPTYGIIRDLAGPGEAVFILQSPLPGAQVNRPGRGFIEKIHAFFFPPAEVPVPILQRIDLKGRVVYTNKIPYAHGIVELKSVPRYTRTDGEGYFVFSDVEEGAHTISVLDAGGNVLAHCQINIERIELDNTVEIKEVELIRLPDGTFVFQVAVDVEVLEITLYLRRGGNGEVLGLERVEPGIVQFGTVKPPSPGEPPLEPPGEKDPSRPPDGPAVEPEKPALPPEEADNPPSGGGGDVPLPPPFNFGVFDTATTVHYGQAGAVNVNIFGAKKRIAPGMSGSYHFTVDNGRNSTPSAYDVTFTAIDTLPAPYKIPMLYRLKADGVYVAGNSAAWCKPPELYQKAVLEAGKEVKYNLEWYWPEGEQDNEYARFGGDPQFSYSMTIKVTAQGQ